MNRLEVALGKYLQERFASEGAELLSPSLSCWREGEMCAQEAVEGNSTITHGDLQSIVPGPSRADVAFVVLLGAGSSSTLSTSYWGQWKCRENQSLMQALQTHFPNVSEASINSASFGAVDCSSPDTHDATKGRCCGINGLPCSIPTL